MRILHLQKVTGVGGSERHLLMLLPALAARGHHVTMVVLRDAGSEPFLAAADEQGVDVVALDAGSHANPALAARLYRLIRRYRPALVHTHLIHADVHGQPAARLAGVPAVSTVHGTPGPYRREPSRSAAAVAGRLARRTLAISEHVAEFLRQRRLAPPGRIRVVRYGIDLSAWDLSPRARPALRASLGVAPGEVAVVVASRLIADKGHAFLLDAFAHAFADRPELRLLVAGEGPLRPALEAQAMPLTSAGAVRFLGFVSDVKGLLGAADVVAFPTMPGFGEGFGLVNLEAMALARPVVATAVDSVPEIVVDGETGLLVAPGDVAALGSALVRLADDEALRLQLGQRGRRRAEEDFNLDRMVDETLAIYADVLDGHRA